MVGKALVVLLAAISAYSVSDANACEGTTLNNVGGVTRVLKLKNSGVAAYAKMNVNIDGYGRAYHPENRKAGAVLHLCNAGKVVLPDGSSYHGSESNATCTGKFMEDFHKIRAAGWNDPSVGAINWYGVLGKGSVNIADKSVKSVKPVEVSDGSGFFVSPTALADPTIKNPDDQARYVSPLKVPSAVAPEGIKQYGVLMGSFGVAIHRTRKIAVPFVVGDRGPKIGEGSVALARLAAGLRLKDTISQSDRFAGQVSEADVLWVFFADQPQNFDSKNQESTLDRASAAFEKWGGVTKLLTCFDSVPRN